MKQKEELQQYVKMLEGIENPQNRSNITVQPVTKKKIILPEKLISIIEKYYDVIGYGCNKHLSLMESSSLDNIVRKLAVDIAFGNDMSLFTKQKLRKNDYKKLHEYITNEVVKNNKFISSKPVRKFQNVFEKVVRGDLSNPVRKNFQKHFDTLNDAALDSRHRGYDTFMYQEKTYTTHLKGETDEQWQAKLKEIRAKHNNAPYGENETPPDNAKKVEPVAAPGNTTPDNTVLTVEQYKGIQQKMYTRLENKGVEWNRLKTLIDNYAAGRYPTVTYGKFKEQMTPLLQASAVKNDEIEKILSPSATNNTGVPVAASSVPIKVQPVSQTNQDATILTAAHYKLIYNKINKYVNSNRVVVNLNDIKARLRHEPNTETFADFKKDMIPLLVKVKIPENIANQLVDISNSPQSPQSAQQQPNNEQPNNASTQPVTSSVLTPEQAKPIQDNINNYLAKLQNVQISPRIKQYVNNLTKIPYIKFKTDMEAMLKSTGKIDVQTLAQLLPDIAGTKGVTGEPGQTTAVPVEHPQVPTANTAVPNAN